MLSSLTPLQSLTPASVIYCHCCQVLHFLREVLDPPCPFSTATAVAAASGGHLAVLQYLAVQQQQQQQQQLHSCSCWSPAVCAAAAAAGHQDVLKWLRHELEPPCPWDHSTCRCVTGQTPALYSYIHTAHLSFLWTLTLSLVCRDTFTAKRPSACCNFRSISVYMHLIVTVCDKHLNGAPAVRCVLLAGRLLLPAVCRCCSGCKHSRSRARCMQA
jgi:hypothetical protein